MKRDEILNKNDYAKELCAAQNDFMILTSAYGGCPHGNGDCGGMPQMGTDDPNSNAFWDM